MGAALATLIARMVSALVMVVLLSKKDNPLCITTPGCMRPQKDVIGKILKIGIPSGIENSMFQVGKLMVVSMITSFGTAAIAANSVSYSIIEFPNIPGMSMGLALITVVGTCLGAGDVVCLSGRLDHESSFVCICRSDCIGIFSFAGSNPDGGGGASLV